MTGKPGEMVQIINPSWAHPRLQVRNLVSSHKLYWLWFLFEFDTQLQVSHWQIQQLPAEEHTSCSSFVHTRRWQRRHGRYLFVWVALARKIPFAESAKRIRIGGLVSKVSPNKSSLIGVYFHAVRWTSGGQGRSSSHSKANKFCFIPSMIYSIETGRGMFPLCFFDCSMAWSVCCGTCCADPARALPSSVAILWSWGQFFTAPLTCLIISIIIICLGRRR